MAGPTLPLIFDGHNDQLSMLNARGADLAVKRFTHNPLAAIDQPRAAAGGFAGGIFAVWVPSHDSAGVDYNGMAEAPFDIPLAREVPTSDALAEAMAQIAILVRLDAAGLVRICRTTADIRAAMAAGVIAAVLHIEGAEPIGTDLAALDVFHAAGLRSLGPVWSRRNAFGHGVPFRFPSTPDTGPGLTEAGKALVRRCNELRILIDLSHITEAGFWDVAALSHGPLVASHSNVHALCPTARNLTNRQLAAIRETGGLVGLNFATAFLRADGSMRADVPLTRMVEHLDHLIDHLGEDGVGLGSDYDGAVVPQTLAGVDQLPRLRAAMAERGYDAALIEKICHGNWLRVLKATWGA